MVENKIEIRTAAQDEYYFVYRLPSDGVFISHFFKSMSEVMFAIENIKRRSTNSNNYLKHLEKSRQAYFVFRENSNDPIGQSTAYEHLKTLDSGIEHMIENLKSAEVVDLTK